MRLLILKSNISTNTGVKRVANVLNPHPAIAKWTVDLDDCDKVLRIESLESLGENEVKNLIQPLGYYCEDLPE